MAGKKSRFFLVLALLIAPGLRAADVAAPGEVPAQAEEVLARVAKVYQDSAGLGVQVFRRILRVSRAQGDGGPLTSNDYQPTASTQQSLTFRRQLPDSFYLKSWLITESSTTQPTGLALVSYAGSASLYRLGIASPPSRQPIASAAGRGENMNLRPLSLAGSLFRTRLSAELGADNNGWPESLWLPDHGDAGSLLNAVISRETTEGNEPAYELELRTGPRSVKIAWVSKQTNLVLRTVALGPASPLRPGVGQAGLGLVGGPARLGRNEAAPSASDLELVESIYQATLDPEFGREDFVLEPGAATAPALDGRPRFTPVHELLAIAASRDPALPPGKSALGAAAPPVPEKQQITADQLNGIVLIEGDKGVATGFVARVHDIAFVVTNLHVLGDNEKLSVKTMQGTPLAVGGIVGAVGADIALLRITQPEAGPPPLTLAADVLRTAQIGDQVVVVGNRLGGDVATQTSGRILGVGPNRIEVNAQFQPGNSGSPVIRTVGGEVLGLATYQEETKLNAKEMMGGTGPIQTEQRWFAFRLDSVEKWETIDWSRWQAQAKRVAAFRENSLALLDLLRGKFDPASRNPRIKEIIAHFNNALARPSVTVGSSKNNPLADSIHDLIRSALAYANEGAKDFANDTYYDFFRSQPYWETSVAEQVKFRDFLVQALTDANNNMRDFQMRVSGGLTPGRDPFGG